MTHRFTLMALLSTFFAAGCELVGPDDPDTGSDVDTGSDTGSDVDTGSDTAADTFAFRTEAPDAYTRVDRAGFPAVNTLLISSKDAYNNANPSDDVAMTFASEIITSLAGLHAMLDDDLAAAGLTPCTVVGDGSGSCLTQAAPLIIPDVLHVDPVQTAGFPNGRTLSDPVLDIVLGVTLLDLSVHDAVTLIGVLNPTANDVEFQTDFPYMAPAH